MITKLSHICIYVLDQASAENFYVNILGFEVHTNAPMGNGVKWLTVHPKGNPTVELTLLPIAEGMMFDAASAEKMRELVKRGTFGFGVFQCTDIFATYEELNAKGVLFSKPPKEEFYGTEAIFKDDSGNWFSLTQPKDQ